MLTGFHKPDEEYGYLSNWYITDFTIDGRVFSSMEQYMMYQKANNENPRKSLYLNDLRGLVIS